MFEKPSDVTTFRGDGMKREDFRGITCRKKERKKKAKRSHCDVTRAS